jgi:type IV pilus assembly protein PilN
MIKEISMAMYKNTIKINLMPHREALKEIRKKEFFTRVFLSVLLACCLILFVWQLLNTRIDAQKNRNDFISSKISLLDQEIAQISTLESEIEALKARQKAVEDLQSDRNLPVYIFQELTSFVPEGIYLKTIKQDSKLIMIGGVAQTQERISEMLRNFTDRSEWLEKPTLVESKLMTLNTGSKAADKVYEFIISVLVKPNQKISSNNLASDAPVVIGLPVKGINSAPNNP